MLSIEYVAELFVVPHPGEDLEVEVAAIMREVVALAKTGCGIADPAGSLDLEHNIMTLEMIATGDDFDDAVVTADSCARSAIHAAGGATPNWTAPVKRAQRTELVDA